MTPSHHTTQPEIDRGFEVLDAAVAAAQQEFGDDLTAAYAFGSLTHGGYDPLVSDIDILFVLRTALTDATRVALDLIEAEVARACPELGSRLAVFWTSEALLPRRTVSGAYPPPDLLLGFLPPLDRLDLLQNGKLLAGRDIRSQVPEPTTDELVIAGAEFALSYLRGPELLHALTHPDELATEDVLTVTKTVLFPVRFLYTLRSGRIGANYAAAEHYVQETEDPARSELVTAAIVWRRSGLPSAATTAATLGRALRQIYVEMIEAYADAAAAIGDDGIERDLRAWAGELAE